MPLIERLPDEVARLDRRSAGSCRGAVVFTRPDEVARVADWLERLGRVTWRVRVDASIPRGRCHVVA